MWWYFSCISPNKLFHKLLKNLSLLACERNLQDFSLYQKIGVIPQIHSTSHGFSPTKPKTCAIWVRKDSLRWVLLTCPWFNSFNCFGHVLFLFLFVLFFLFKKKHPKTLKIFKKKTKIFYFVSSFIFRKDYMNYDISLDLEHAWHCGETWIVRVISAKLFLILCEYALVCTCTQGLIKKLIFLVCVPSIA